MNTTVCFVAPAAYGYFNNEEGFTAGGAERQLYLLSTHLSEQFDVHFVVGDYGQPETEVREGVTLHKAYAFEPRNNVFKSINHLTLLALAMRRADADVYINRGSPRKAAIVYYITKILRKRFIYHIANDDYLLDETKRPYVTRTLYKKTIRNASKVVSQTSHQQKLAKKEYDADSIVIPNGYPTTQIRPELSDREYFLWVGRLTEGQKRPHIYLDLAEQNPELVFRLIGPCDESISYQRSVKKRANELDNVEYLGETPPNIIHKHFKNAIALINTSTHEGFPNTFLEAWRYGTPVISHKVNPNRFLAQPINVFSNTSIEKMSSLINDLSTHGDWSRISQEIKKKFEQQYSISSISKIYSRLIDEVKGS